MGKKLSSVRKTLYVIPFILMLSISDILLAEIQEAQLAELLWYDVFGRLSAGKVQTIVLSTESLSCMFLFSLLYGSCISDFFASKMCIRDRYVCHHQ